MNYKRNGHAAPKQGRAPNDLPLAIEAEQGVLGLALGGDDLCVKILETCIPEDFHAPGHEAIFSRIVARHKKGLALDYLTMLEEGENPEQREYLYKLIREAPLGQNWESYCRILIERWAERRLIETGRTLSQRVLEREMSADAATKELLTLAERVNDRISGRQPKVVTAAELMEMDLPTIWYLVPGIFSQGLTLLHADPKAGKTRLAEALAYAAATGGKFLGQFEVEQCDVLTIFLEDVWQTEKERLFYLTDGQPGPTNWYMATDWPILDKGGHRFIQRFLDDHPKIKLIVIDTLQHFRGQVTRKDLYGADVDFIRPLQKMALERELCLIIIHHSSKAKDRDMVTAASGTQGLVGTADVSMRLETKGDNIALWTGKGRFIPQFTHSLELDPIVGWKMRDSLNVALGVTAEGRDEAVYAALKDGPKTSKRVQEYCTESGMRPDATRQALSRLKRGKKIQEVAGYYFLPTWKYGNKDVPKLFVYGKDRDWKERFWYRIDLFNFPATPPKSEWQFVGGIEQWTMAIQEWSPAQLKDAWLHVMGSEYEA
jgi:hypothetical protein